MSPPHHGSSEAEVECCRNSSCDSLVRPGLAEGEGVGLDAWVEEGDLEGAVAYGAGLADELVQAWFGDGAVALIVDVGSVGGTHGLAVQVHAEPHRCPWGSRSHDQVQVAGVEAVGDAPVGLVEHDRLPPDRPVTREGPVVEPQPLGDGIDLRGVKDRTVGGREVLGALVAEVVLRGPQAGPVGGGLHPTGLDRNQVLADAAAAGLAQQLLQDHLGLLVLALAEAMVPNLPLGVDEVERRPIAVPERIPDPIVVVDRDRVVDLQVRGGSADVGEVVLEPELGGVDAEHDQPLVLVLVGPGADIGKRPQPVDAGVGPEVDQHNAAAQAGHGQRRRVQPAGRAVQRRHPPFNRQLDRRRVGGGAQELVGSGEEPRPFACPLGHRSLLQGGKPSTPMSTPSPSTQTSSRSTEQPLDGALGLLVASFADVVVTDDAVGVVSVQKSTRTTWPRSSAGPSGSESSHSVAPPSAGMCRGSTTVTYRSDLNAARTSSENSCGSSQAAKWPPRSTSLK